MIHTQTDLLDSPQVRKFNGHPVWLARLTIDGWTINGRSRFRLLAWIKAVANYATWIAGGCRVGRRPWWAPRWD